MALWWLLPAGVARVGLVGAELGKLLEELEGLEGLRPGKRQP